MLGDWKDSSIVKVSLKDEKKFEDTKIFVYLFYFIQTLNIMNNYLVRHLKVLKKEENVSYY